MAKTSGLGQRLLVGGYDISGDIQALDNVHGGPAPLDVTDITQSAHSRIGGLRDGGLGASAFFDSVNAHVPLSALPAADVLASYLLNVTLGGPAAVCVAKQVGYDPTRGADGSLMLKTQLDANAYGLEWGVQLTPGVRTDTTATAASSSNSIDTTASKAFGAQAYLQVTAFSGTSVTCIVKDSPDNSTFTTVSGLSFTAVTAAPAWQRLATANSATIGRYLAVATTGTFTSASFSIVIVKNLIAGQVF